MVMSLLVLFFISDVGRYEQRKQCDVIELNHKVDECGRHCYTQIILWNWKPEVCRHHVDSWWMVEPSNLHLLPARTANGWIVRRFDGSGKRSSVIARVYRETTTINDPETDDKKLWHESWRRPP